MPEFNQLGTGKQIPLNTPLTWISMVLCTIFSFIFTVMEWFLSQVLQAFGGEGKGFRWFQILEVMIDVFYILALLQK